MNVAAQANPDYQAFTPQLRALTSTGWLMVIGLAACAPSGSGGGQSSFESAVSTASRNLAPILSELSAELGEVVGRFDTSPEDQKALALTAAEETEREHSRVQDPMIETYLTQMARKIAHGRGADHWDYEVAVIEDQELNAFTIGA